MENQRKIFDVLKESNVSNIETQEQFWLFIEDTKNQFQGLRILLDEELGDDEIVHFIKKYTFNTISEYLKKENKTFSEKILHNDHVKNLVHRYDDIVSRVKTLKTGKELYQILEELDELFARFNLELDK